tara:strand:- start:253 stop:717 length:465 start_codon:yes stop_codon:yes gene_type:complete
MKPLVFYKPLWFGIFITTLTLNNALWGADSNFPPKAHISQGEFAANAYLYICQDGLESDDPTTPQIRGYHQLSYDFTTQRISFSVSFPHSSWSVIDLNTPPYDISFLDTPKKIKTASILLGSLIENLKASQDMRIKQKRESLKEIHFDICLELI